MAGDVTASGCRVAAPCSGRHQADVEDDLSDAPEAAGLDTIVRALGLDRDDETVRKTVATIFDSLYHYLRRETLGLGGPT